MKIPKTPLPKRGNLAKYQSNNPLQKYLIRRFLAVIRSVVRDAPSGLLCETGCGEGFVLRNLGDQGL